MRGGIHLLRLRTHRGLARSSLALGASPPNGGVSVALDERIGTPAHTLIGGAALARRTVEEA
jgi:hypothetical protein